MQYSHSPSQLSLVCDSSLFYENPRYIMFICMVINDALQLSLVTSLYVVSYIFSAIHPSVCCCLVRWINSTTVKRKRVFVILG